MDNANTINLGLDKIARLYLDNKLDRNHAPIVISRIGVLKNVKIHRYKLRDGSIAEEFLQFCQRDDNGCCTYFLGLKVGNKFMQWPYEKIKKKLIKKNSN